MPVQKKNNPPASQPRRKHRRGPAPGKPLPPPLEVQSQQPGPPPPPAPQSSGLFGLGNVFRPNHSPPPQGTIPSPAVSGGSSTTSYDPPGAAPLTSEAEQLLGRMPKTIGEISEPGNGIPAAAGEVEDPIAALMAQVAFEEQDVQDTLGEFFDWMSERFKSEHWKLTDRQSRMLGRPTAQMLNSIWAKLQDYLPDILARWCETTPGATAFILACGIVVAPKVKKQFTISRERRKPGPRLVSRPGQAESAMPAGPATPAQEEERAHFPSGITYAD